MSLEISVYDEKVVETLPPEIEEEYLQYAKITWNSISEMTYDDTGLPADQLHHHLHNGIPTGEVSKIDRTSPTNIGFLLASIGAAYAMGFISEQETHKRLGQTITTIIKMTKDPETFIETTEGKGLFVNWIEPSTGRVLKEWPNTETEIKQQISTVDMAWLIAFSKMIGAQFPEFSDSIQSFLDKMDLPFMFNHTTGFFSGCYNIKDKCFEPWQYDVLSEARIAYLICEDGILQEMSKLINRRTDNSVFKDSKQRNGRRTWNGEYFALGWPTLVIPEDRFSSQWEETIKSTIQLQREYGEQHNFGHYGYSAGLGPDGKYFEYRVPQTGESTEPYIPQPIVTISALVNMGIVYPQDTLYALKRLHQEFPSLTHPLFGDGDTVNTHTGEIQRDQILPNQATILLSCWNIVRGEEPRNIFSNVLPPSTESIYKQNLLW